MKPESKQVQKKNMSRGIGIHPSSTALSARLIRGLLNRVKSPSAQFKAKWKLRETPILQLKKFTTSILSVEKTNLRIITPGENKSNKSTPWNPMNMVLPNGSQGDSQSSVSPANLGMSNFSAGQVITPFVPADTTPIFPVTNPVKNEDRSAPAKKWQKPDPGARRHIQIEEVHSTTPQSSAFSAPVNEYPRTESDQDLPILQMTDTPSMKTGVLTKVQEQIQRKPIDETAKNQIRLPENSQQHETIHILPPVSENIRVEKGEPKPEIVNNNHLSKEITNNPDSSTEIVQQKTPSIQKRPDHLQVKKEQVQEQFQKSTTVKLPTVHTEHTVPQIQASPSPRINEPVQKGHPLFEENSKPLKEGTVSKKPETKVFNPIQDSNEISTQLIAANHTGKAEPQKRLSETSDNTFQQTVEKVDPVHKSIPAIKMIPPAVETAKQVEMVKPIDRSNKSGVNPTGDFFVLPVKKKLPISHQKVARTIRAQNHSVRPAHNSLQHLPASWPVFALKNNPALQRIQRKSISVEPQKTEESDKMILPSARNSIPLIEDGVNRKPEILSKITPAAGPEIRISSRTLMQKTSRIASHPVHGQQQKITGSNRSILSKPQNLNSTPLFIPKVVLKFNQSNPVRRQVQGLPVKQILSDTQSKTVILPMRNSTFPISPLLHNQRKTLNKSVDLKKQLIVIKQNNHTGKKTPRMVVIPAQNGFVRQATEIPASKDKASNTPSEKPAEKMTTVQQSQSQIEMPVLHSLAHGTSENVIQRSPAPQNDSSAFEDIAADTSLGQSEGTEEEQKKKKKSIQEIASIVYPLVRQMLEIETERKNGRVY